MGAGEGGVGDGAADEGYLLVRGLVLVDLGRGGRTSWEPKEKPKMRMCTGPRLSWRMLVEGIFLFFAGLVVGWFALWFG